MNRVKLEESIKFYISNASKMQNSYPLDGLEKEYAAYCFVLNNGERGVAFKYDGQVVDEDFVSIRLKSIDLHGWHKFLFLSSSDERVYKANEFIAVCLNFLDPGENGKLRKEILDNPLSWWKRWKEIMGNSISSKLPYTVLGELYVYLYLVKTGEKPMKIIRSTTICIYHQITSNSILSVNHCKIL